MFCVHIKSTVVFNHTGYCLPLHKNSFIWYRRYLALSTSMFHVILLQHLFSGFPPSPLLVDIQLLVVDFNRTHVTQVITRQFGTSCCGYISNDGRHPVDPIDRKRQHDQHWQNEMNETQGTGIVKGYFGTPSNKVHDSSIDKQHEKVRDPNGCWKKKHLKSGTINFFWNKRKRGTQHTNGTIAKRNLPVNLPELLPPSAGLKLTKSKGSLPSIGTPKAAVIMQVTI